MPSYPITLPIPSSLAKGKSTKSELREYATLIKNHINRHSQMKPVTVFNYSTLADELGIGKKIIKAFLASIGGGSNGITINNPNFAKEKESVRS